MKKYIARILTCALVLGTLSTAALAAEMTIPGEEHSVTLSDVVATEAKTLTIDDEQKNVTVYYVTPGSTFQCNLVDHGGEGLSSNGYFCYQYEEQDGGYVSTPDNVYDYGVPYTFSAELFGGMPMYSVYTDAYVMLDGQQGTGAVAATNGATTPAAPATTTGSTTYTVVKYDTLGQIALNNYGSYKYHTALYKANAAAFKATGGALKPGMVLTLPDTLGTAKRIGTPIAGDGETLYTVKAGDTLGGIAKSVYGDVMKYQAIFERNSDRLTNANTIYEGQVLVLPAK